MDFYPGLSNLSSDYPTAHGVANAVPTCRLLECQHDAKCLREMGCDHLAANIEWLISEVEHWRRRATSRG